MKQFERCYRAVCERHFDNEADALAWSQTVADFTGRLVYLQRVDGDAEDPMQTVEPSDLNG
jgi:hypothetical protein